MVTLQELKKQIEDANALGIKNLADKGVGFVGFSPTTYEIMQGISDIIRDRGVQYTSIIYKEDDTIELLDTDGVTHTMVCEYEDDKLKSVTYDGKEIKLHYTDDALDMVGKTEVNLSNAKTSGVATVDYTVTFLADGEPYEVVSVKDGNTVNAPSGTPTSDIGTFTGWKLNGGYITFPHKPEANDIINAVFQSARTEFEINQGNTAFATVDSKTLVKTSDGWSIAGYIQGGNSFFVFLVGETKESATFNCDSQSYFDFDYNGRTYYYQFLNCGSKEPTMKAGCTENLGSFGMVTDGAIKLLDYYFMKT
jgi:hypothetical protein